MKRREFNLGLLAAGTAPLVKIPAAVKAAPAVAAAGNFTPFMYASGAHFARFNGSCSPELLASRFGLSPQAAQAISSRLIKNGVIAAPNALGISQSLPQKPPPTFQPAHTKAQATQTSSQHRVKMTQEPVQSDLDNVDEPDLVAEQEILEPASNDPTPEDIEDLEQADEASSTPTA